MMGCYDHCDFLQLGVGSSERELVYAADEIAEKLGDDLVSRQVVALAVATARRLREINDRLDKIEEKLNGERSLVNEIKVHDHGYVRYVDHMGSDTRIVEAARISYGEGSKGEQKDKRLLRYLYTNRHTTPFEQVGITFNIRMPIFVARQYVRHRMQSINEISARYKQLPDLFYIPEKFRSPATDNKQSSVDSEISMETADRMESLVRGSNRRDYDTYKTLIELGVANELARIVLPVNIYTEIYATWDLHNLIHFFRLRLHPHAQLEVRDYAAAMKTITAQHFPWTMELFDAEVQPSNS